MANFGFVTFPKRKNPVVMTVDVKDCKKPYAQQIKGPQHGRWAYNLLNSLIRAGAIFP